MLDKLNLGERHIPVQGLWGSSRALLMVCLQARKDVPILAVSFSHQEAQSLYDDLQFFEQAVPGPDYEAAPGTQGKPSRVVFFPDWQILPYERLAPETNVTAERLAILHRLWYGEPQIVVTTIQALMQKLLPPETLDQATELLETGQQIKRESLLQTMVEGGYRAVDIVENMGEYSLKGGILDLWGPYNTHPIRLEFFGDEIESIRRFNYETQRSVDTINQALILPVRETVLKPEVMERLKKQLATHARPALRQYIMQALEQGQELPGLEHYMAYMYPQMSSLLNYMPENSLIFLDEFEYIKQHAQEHEILIEQEYSQAEAQNYPAPKQAFFSLEQIEAQASSHQRIYLDSLKLKESRSRGPLHYEVSATSSLRFTLQGRKEEQGFLAAIASEMRAWQQKGEQVWLICQNAGQAQRMREILRQYELASDLSACPQIESQKGNDTLKGFGLGTGRNICPPYPLFIWVGTIHAGFHLPQLGLRVIPEADIFGEAKKPKPRASYKSSRFLSTFSDLKVGDYIVHVDHGIGLYRGLTQLSVDTRQMDFLFIEYAGGDKLYLPVDRLHLVQKYMGGKEEGLALNKLGGPAWSQLKRKIKASIMDMAQDLLKIYATRQVVPGHVYPADSQWQQEFEAAFPFEETPDQLKAIEDVKRDMESPKPMDRLICGDVGYGKTEVALRAAFKAVSDGKQVAVLVPTTVLAQQHYHTFSRRLAAFPFRVEMVSRFRTLPERKKVMAGLKTGEVDIVIGTHRLLQKDVQFKELGLIVVDEEQHFGVAHKERLKVLRQQVDVLTLTATPIPRTLHMALMGVRDMSIIDTPPEDRMDIHTDVLPYDEQVIREAILRELERGGQVFFINNQVENIEKIAQRLRELVPEASFGVGHGQMQESALEQVMMDFVERKFEVLVCTTIIEAGMDIPSANTIIINRADMFGLAQMYQLRGRVGRSNQRAYAYLMIPPNITLNEKAMKRLRAIQELSHLGAGFRLAAHDLEIRGAGNILGPQQHGEIVAVGFDLYCQLMEEAVSELKGHPPPAKIEPTIDLGVEARIPQEYIEDVNQRLNIYQRISGTDDEEQLTAIAQEVEDRYGKLPEPVQLLLQVMQVNIGARRLHITKIQRQGSQVAMGFADTTPVARPRIIQLLQQRRSPFRLNPEGQLVYRLDSIQPDQLAGQMASVFKQLRTE